MITTDATTTTTLDLLKAQLAKAKADHADACAKVDEANAVPAGKRGRKTAIAAAYAVAQSVRDRVDEVTEQIREVAATAVNAWARRHLDGVEDEVLLQILNAPRHNVTLRTEVGDVFASVSRDALGFPTYVELRELAGVDEVIEQATKWRDTAKDEETRVAAQAILANPSGYAMYARASAVGSITVSTHHRWLDADEDQGANYYLNASTSQAYTDRDVDVALRLVLVARLLREKLNALALPSESSIRAKIKGLMS